MVDFKKLRKKARAKKDILELIIDAHENPELSNSELLKQIDTIVENLTNGD
jgi:hypothetical protein